MLKVYELYLPCEISEVHTSIILTHEVYFTDDQFKDAVVRVMDRVKSTEGGLSYNDVYNGLLEDGFREPIVSSLNWVDAASEIER